MREGRPRAERADRWHRDGFDRICGPAAVAAVFDRAPDRVLSTALGRGRPPALIGLDAATLAARTDMRTIPGSGRVQSLNVASAAAILIYGLTRG